MNMNRRRTLRGIGLAGLGGAVWAVGLAGPATLLAAGDRNAFDERLLRDAFDALGISNPLPTDALRLDAPDVADNGGFVPVEIVCDVPDASSLSVFVDRNPYPYVARFKAFGGGIPYLMLRVRFAETSPLRVVAGTGDGHRFAMKEVRVVSGGCAGDIQHPTMTPMTSRPIKIRARMAGDGADVRALMEHPMENGLRKDAAGNVIPAHYIRRVTVDLNGRTALEAHFGRSVSTDPLIGFRLPGAKPGDRLLIGWEDSRGASRRDEAMIAA